MKNFKEFQFGIIVFITTIPIQICLVFMFTTQAGTHPMSLTSFAIENGVFGIIYLLFYGMTITIDRQFIHVSYGIGVIHKTIRLVDVKSVRVVSSPWYYGVCLLSAFI